MNIFSDEIKGINENHVHEVPNAFKDDINTTYEIGKEVSSYESNPEELNENYESKNDCSIINNNQSIISENINKGDSTHTETVKEASNFGIEDECFNENFVSKNQKIFFFIFRLFILSRIIS